MPKQRVNKNSLEEFDIKSISPKRESTIMAGEALSLEDRVTACMTYFLTGSYTKTAKAVGASYATILKWKDMEWWMPTLLICKKKKQEELDIVLTTCIHSAIGQLSDRISEGDSKLNRDGDLIKIPMTGKDLASSMALLFDRRALIRGEPTSRTETSGEQGRLDNLQKQFEEMSKAFNAKTIEGTAEVVEVE